MARKLTTLKLYLDAQSPKIQDKCLRCERRESSNWDQSNCYAVPDFGIDSKGELEHLICSFFSWLTSQGFPVPKDEQLTTVNSYQLYPAAMVSAIAETSTEGIPNLVLRYQTYLEKIRTQIVSQL